MLRLLLTPFGAIAAVSSLVYVSWVLQGAGGINYWLGWPEQLAFLATDGQVWRLWTPAIQHFSLLHLVVNLYFFYWLSELWLKQRSTLSLCLFLLFAGIASNAAEAAATTRDFGGLSGIVYALLGFELAIVIAQRVYNIRAPDSEVFNRPELVIGLLGLLLLGFTGIFAQLANMAHLGGLLFGMAIATAMLSFDRYRPSNSE